MIPELNLYYFQTDKLGAKYHPVRALSFRDAVKQAAVIINLFTDYALFDCEEKISVTNGDVERMVSVHCEFDNDLVTMHIITPIGGLS